MTPLHCLLFWFVIKNIIPHGQGHNLADDMDMYYIDLLDPREHINLLAIMISHISRIANTAREHDLGYDFLLTSVLSISGCLYRKKWGCR